MHIRDEYFFTTYKKYVSDSPKILPGDIIADKREEYLSFETTDAHKMCCKLLKTLQFIT